MSPVALDVVGSGSDGHGLPFLPLPSGLQRDNAFD